MLGCLSSSKRAIRFQELLNMRDGFLVSSQERGEHVSANSSDIRRHSNKGRWVIFIIILFLFLIFIPYIAVYIQVNALLTLLYILFFGLVFGFGVLIAVLLLDSHPNE
jgi:hypothetical protein